MIFMCSWNEMTNRKDGVLLHRYGELSHLDRQVSEVLMDVLDHGLRVVTGEEEAQQFPVCCE